MDVRMAKLVRTVARHENWDGVVKEAKALTWVDRVEHALLETRDGQFLLVSGGYDGINLSIGPTGVTMTSTNQTHDIARLCWHIHPRPTGPSDQDRRLLTLLGQQRSIVFEINGPVSGTTFGPK